MGAMYLLRMGSVCGMVKADLPNGKWAHRRTTDEDVRNRRVMARWFSLPRDEKTRKKSHTLAELFELDKKEQGA